MSEKPYDTVPIYPGRGGLNDAVNPVLLEDDEASLVQDIDFDGRSIQKSLGWRKLNRDRPVLAGLNFRPTPVPRVSADLDGAFCPWVVIPYNEVQDAGSGTESLQLDISFRLNHQLDDCLTGVDQSDDYVNAPVGGEYQFQPLVMRGGSDVEPLRWVLGVGIVNPEGTGANASDLIRPIFIWYDDVPDDKYKISAANAFIVPGLDYHLSLRIDYDNPDLCGWYINGSEKDQLESGTLVVALPTVVDLYSAGEKYALYVARPITRETGEGRTEAANLSRGQYGLVSTGWNSTTITTAASQFTPDDNDLYIGYFVRRVSDGEIHQLSDSTGTQLITSETWSSPVAVDTFDLILPMECCNKDVTISELRMWNELQSTESTGLFSINGERLLDGPISQYGSQGLFSILGLSATELVGYWPMTDDGGTVVHDWSGTENHGWFCGTPASRSDGLLLDGVRTAIQMDLSEEPDLYHAFSYNLGNGGRYTIHGRTKFRICRGLANNGEAAILDALYETIFDWDDPDGSSPDPILSLRLANLQGVHKFYFVWQPGNDNQQTLEVPVASESNPQTSSTISLGLLPQVGRWYSLVFGVQTVDGNASHRFYCMILDGTDDARGYSTNVSKTVSDADPGKTRISFGASVVGEEAKGSGTHNAGLFRFQEVAWALRPMVNTRSVAGGLPSDQRQLALNPWTSPDSLISPEDVLLPISSDVATVALARGSTAISTTSGQEWSKAYGFYPLNQILAVMGARRRYERKNREPVERPKFVHGTSFSLTTGTIAEPWDRDSQAGAALYVAAYLGFTDFETPLQEFPLNSTAPSGESWALTDIFPDKGALGSVDPLWWKIAILPSSPDHPQATYAPKWADGIVKGLERVKGLGQLKKTDGTRKIVAGVNGSLYHVRHRWVRDHPFFGQEDASGNTYEWSIEFQNLPWPQAVDLERTQPLQLARDRSTDPVLGDGVRVNDGTGAKLWVPNDLVSRKYLLFECWVRLFKLDGIRTICSRVGTNTDASGKYLATRVNHWFYLEDGCPVFEIRDDSPTGTASDLLYRFELAANAKSRIREAVLAGKWLRVGAMLALNDTTTFGNPAFFVNNQKWSGTSKVHVTNLNTMTPGDIPDYTGCSYLGVYGTDYAARGTSFRYGLGGRMALFRLLQSDTEFEEGPAVGDAI